jgi:hypothetical protein
MTIKNGKRKAKNGISKGKTLDLWLSGTILDHLCQHAFVEIG